MSIIPVKAQNRIVNGLKKFQPVLDSAKNRDVNESDTVLIVTDILHEIFGFERYSEITSEHSIKGTYCDLALKIEGSLTCLVEVKAIGLELKDAFVKQAVDYAVNQGVDWTVLTNGIIWRVYKVHFTKPIDNELVVEFNFLNTNPKDEEHLEMIWLLAKEGWQKERLGEYHEQKQALSKYSMSALLLSDNLIDFIRKELKKLNPGIKIDGDEIAKVLRDEIIKRDILESDRYDTAKKHIQKVTNKIQRSKQHDKEEKKDASVVSLEEKRIEKELSAAPEVKKDEGKEKLPSKSANTKN